MLKPACDENFMETLSWTNRKQIKFQKLIDTKTCHSLFNYGHCGEPQSNLYSLLVIYGCQHSQNMWNRFSSTLWAYNLWESSKCAFSHYNLPIMRFSLNLVVRHLWTTLTAIIIKLHCKLFVELLHSISWKSVHNGREWVNSFM